MRFEQSSYSQADALHFADVAIRVNYFSIICKVGFTIESQAATVVWRRDISLMPIFSIMLRAGRGRFYISFEFICFDFERMEMYLS